MLALNEPIFSQAAATRNHCPFPFSAIKFYIRMIACLLDLRTLFLGRVTFLLARSLASCIIHPDPGKHALVVIDAAALAAAACTIADRDRGSICIHCDDDDPRVAVAVFPVHLVFGGMQHATDGRTANGGDGFQRGRERGGH